MWEEFGKAMEKNIQLASRKFWQIIRCLRKAKQGLPQTVFSQGGELLTQTRDIGRWWKEHFKALLNLTDTSSVDEAKSEDFEKDLECSWQRSLRRYCMKWQVAR